ncbi:hypothetical protein BOTBODRAFT_178513 [Botryobasidium botryosum FD-172 SS1]|uniref:F-box domain-containing protein n=1 Tax=Botryobasidium botryosum (strain FD-172 SS1) TaxID=930990 RepID=A0A067M2G4_BOTB1|nr:hypothetical protein BOTBODRAFT_178513 [Botryobasidium botryosum FD-172 SS1]
MPGLLSLNYDIFSTISCMLDQRSRLHLALTCSLAKGAIIPNILFKHVELTHDFDQIFQFYRAIMNPYSSAAVAVRSFTCRAKAGDRSHVIGDILSLLGHVMEKTVNLHTIDAVLGFHSTGPQLFRKICALPKLRNVTLRKLYTGQLQYISTLAQLRTLRVSFQNGQAPMGGCVRSLISIMLGSQQTPEVPELSPMILLQLEHLFTASPSEDQPPAWPSLRIFDAFLSSPSVGSPSLGSDISSVFPSVRHFLSPLRVDDWLSSPPSRAFLSRLTSVEGWQWESVRAIVEAGAPLQRVAVTLTRWTPGTDLGFLPCGLECFSMALKEEDVPAFVCHLSEITLSRMKVFHLQIESTPRDPHQVQSLATLAGIDWITDLDYLSVEWMTEDYIPYQRGEADHCFLDDFVTAAPSIRQIRTCVFGHAKHWRRLASSGDTSKREKGAGLVELSAMQSSEEDKYHRVDR